MTCKLKNRYIAALILFLFSANTFAETFRLNANYFVRSGLENPDDEDMPLKPKNFIDESNKVGVLNKGTEFEVMQIVQLANGAEALQIKVTQVSNKSYFKASSNGIWIYKNNEKHFTNISEGALVDSKPRFEPTPRAETQAKAKCVECDNVKKQSDQTAQNFKDLSAIPRAVEQDKNEVKPTSKMPPKPEPVPVVVAKPKPSSATAILPVTDDKTKVADQIMNKDKDPTAASAVPSGLSKVERQVARYRNSSQLKAALASADVAAMDETNRQCHKYVKDALMATDANGNALLTNRYVGVAARTGLKGLEQAGFINLMKIEPYSKIKKPSQFPKGTVLIYSSHRDCPRKLDKRRRPIGPRIPNCGHIEMKTGDENQDGYVYDTKTSKPINETEFGLRHGSSYKLIGAMIKPMGD